MPALAPTVRRSSPAIPQAVLLPNPASIRWDGSLFLIVAPTVS